MTSAQAIAQARSEFSLQPVLHDGSVRLVSAATLNRWLGGVLDTDVDNGPYWLVCLLGDGLTVSDIAPHDPRPMEGVYAAVHAYYGFTNFAGGLGPAWAQSCASIEALPDDFEAVPAATQASWAKTPEPPPTPNAKMVAPGAPVAIAMNTDDARQRALIDLYAEGKPRIEWVRLLMARQIRLSHPHFRDVLRGPSEHPYFFVVSSVMPFEMKSRHRSNPELEEAPAPAPEHQDRISRWLVFDAVTGREVEEQVCCPSFIEAISLLSEPVIDETETARLRTIGTWTPEPTRTPQPIDTGGSAATATPPPPVIANYFGPGDPSEAAALQVLPLVPGNWWAYQYFGTDSLTSWSATVITDTVREAGRTADGMAVFRIDTEAAAGDVTGFRAGPSRWITLVDGRFEEWNPAPASLEGRLDDTPLGAFLALPPTLERLEPTSVFAGSRQPGWLYDGLLPIDTRAGAFRNCQLMRLPMNHDTHTRWFCPGIGLVHEERITVMGRGDSQLDLLRYHVAPQAGATTR